MPGKNNQEKKPLLEQKGQTASYRSIQRDGINTSPKDRSTSGSYEAGRHFFAQKFKRDFLSNGLNGDNSLNVFNFDAF
jgi:hypothetical protein